MAETPAAARPEPQHLTLALLGHTNVGKTTLARTLLQRDVGEVLDRSQVTTHSEAHEWLHSPAGDTLALLDTPGLMDSAALARRIALSGWRAWWQRELLDRWRAPALRQALRALAALRTQADALLYIVNTAEPPQDTAHLGAELALLRWLDRPTLVLLNQLGPATPEARQAEAQRWQAAIAAHEGPPIHAVLPLDAFCRSPADEAALLAALPQALPPGAAAALARLHACWQQRHQERQTASLRALATLLAELAGLSEPLPAAGTATPASGWRQGLSSLGQLARSVGRPAATPPEQAHTADTPTAAEQALQALLLQVEQRMQANTQALLALQGLSGLATTDTRAPQPSVAAALVAQVQDRLLHTSAAPLDGKRLGLWGGLLSGAAAGLGADLAAGGLTLGAGALIGAVVGALGSAGLAHGINLYTGQQGQAPQVRLSDAALQELFIAGLLRLLSVSHFGRGRGLVAEGATPAHWLPAVQVAAAPLAEALKALWPELRQAGADTPEGRLARDQLQALHQQACDQLSELRVPASTS